VSLTIVLGTSRCGSTMLSRMLHLHPEVLSISEFWNCFRETIGGIPSHDMSGEEFWQTITGPAPFYDDLIRSRIKQDEDLRPFPSRFNYITGMPPFARILATFVPDGPDPLYDELAPEVSSWPQRPVAEHCAALFTEIAVKLGRGVIAERSGGSLIHAAFLLQQFPQARFVFLHRNGPDTALSMSRHPIVRIYVMRIIASAIENSSSEPAALLEMLPASIKIKNIREFEGLIAPPYDRERFLAFPLPLSCFGWFWSDLTQTGAAEIRGINPDKWMPLRYERLLKDTRAEMTRLADFIGVPAEPQWLDKTCEFANPGRSGSAEAQLIPDDLAALRDSCVAGAQAFDRLESEHLASAVPAT
jgi:hypothetical protein